MTVIRCAVCPSDPAGRWRQPPAIIFIDPYRDDDGKYACRDHLSEKKEAEIKTREKNLGWPLGGLR